MKKIYFFLLLLLSNAVIAQKIGYLDDYEVQDFYGGYAWDYEIGEYRGDYIIFVSMSGGDGIYYATFPKDRIPKKFNWQPFYATRMGGPFFFAGTEKMVWHEESEQLFFIHDLDLYRAKLGEEAEFQYSCNDFLLLGDTLISTVPTRGGRQFIRAEVNVEGKLKEINREYGPPNFNFYNSYYRLGLDPKTKKVIYWGDTLLHTAEPYYSKASQLTYHLQPLRFDRSRILGDPVCHVDQSGVWHVLGSQNSSFWLGPDDTTGANRPKPRLWYRSYDRGMSWEDPEELNGEWPLPYTMPPIVSSARDANGQHLCAGTLYYAAHKGWQNLGRRYKSHPGLFVYNGTSTFLPGRASVAFHASNLGPAMSTNYGDSLFLISEGLVASPMTDFYYESRAQAFAVASQQQIAVVQEAGTPYEKWQFFTSPEKYPSENQVAYDAENDILYLANSNKLYRRSLVDGTWEAILDPQADFDVFMGWNDRLLDLAIDPRNSGKIAVLVESYDPNYYLFYSLDGGASWDTVLPPMDWPIVENLKWFPHGDNDSRLYFSQNTFGYGLNDQFFYYHFSADSLPVLRQDSLPGFSGYGHVVQYDQIPESDRVVALTTIEPQTAINRPVDFTLAIQNEQGNWDTLYGEWVEDCYGCYSFPNSIAAHDDFIFIGVGHWLFMYQYGFGQLRYVGRRPNPLPRGENHRHLQFIDNYLYTGGEYGVYRQDLNEYGDPDYPNTLWNFYPNPSTGLLRVQPPGAISIYTLQGQKVFQSERARYQYDLAHLPQGMYIVRHPKGGGKLWYRQ